MKPSIYTRTGDKGRTRLGGGKAVYKNDLQVDAFGDIDHLNSLCGLARTYVQKDEHAIDIQEDLLTIQQFLFDCSSDLSIPKGHREYKITQQHIDWLEEKINVYDEEPPEILYFIIPGGTEAASWLHVLRTTTRNTERKIVSFMQAEPEEGNPFVLTFINRLSDYFFVIARVLNVRNNTEDVPYERSEKVFHVSREKREETK